MAKLSKYQKALKEAFSEARLHGMSFAVLKDLSEEKYNNEYYVVVSCETLFTNFYNDPKKYQLMEWMHPKIIPAWKDYGIYEEEA